MATRRGDEEDETFGVLIVGLLVFDVRKIGAKTRHAERFVQRIGARSPSRTTIRATAQPP
jgi:hypothetical protein